MDLKLVLLSFHFRLILLWNSEQLQQIEFLLRERRVTWF